MCDVRSRSHTRSSPPKTEQDMTTIKEYVTAGATDPPERLEKKEKLMVRVYTPKYLYMCACILRVLDRSPGAPW